jgi:hypothetical protein
VTRHLALTALLLGACAVDSTPDPETRWTEGRKPGKADLSDPRLAEVYRDSTLWLVTDDASHRPALVQQVVPEIEDAYAFDTDYQGWAGQPALAKPFEAAIASDATMQSITGQAGGGIDWDADSFITDSTVLSSKPSDVSFEAFVLAHELEHMHMERLGATEPAIPIYAFEGIACVTGDWFVDLRQVTGWDALLRGQAAGLATMTAADGRDLFASFATAYGPFDRIYWREQTGGLFFEFVRAHLETDPDRILEDWGRLTLAVAGGKTFEQAFVAAYGTSLASAQDQFVTFLGATVGDPHARFLGTVWSGLEPGAP